MSESLFKKFFRAARRWVKLATLQPIDLDDIGVIKMGEPWGAVYKAERIDHVNWQVTRHTGVAPSKGNEVPLPKIEVVCAGLPLEFALQAMRDENIDAFAHKAHRRNHPVQVAKLAGYEFKMGKPPRFDGPRR